MENIKILKKIFEARKKIKQSKLKKEGYNDYSKYDYFTPEQIDKLVTDACNELNIINLYELKRTELGLMAQINVIDLDSGENKIFESATDIPILKATNVSQQIGGAMTFSNRYLLMFIYDIVDNNLDFDTSKKQEKKPNNEDNNNPWLGDKEYLPYIARIKKGEFGSSEDKCKEFINKLSQSFKINKKYRAGFLDEFNKLKSDLPESENLNYGMISHEDL